MNWKCLALLAFSHLTFWLLFGQNAELSAAENGEVTKTSSVAKEKASALLSAAEVYLQAGDYSGAEKKAVEALSIAPPESQIRKDSEALLLKALAKAKESKRQKQETLLEEADRLSSEGRFDQASALIQKLLNEADDPHVVKQAESSLAKAHPSFYGLVNNAYQSTYTLLGWILNLILGILATISFYLLLKVLQLVWTLLHCDAWLLAGIADSTGLGTGDLILNSLRNWSGVIERTPASAGLIKLEMFQIPSVPKFDLQQVAVDLASVAESLPQLGGISLGAYAKTVLAVRRWMNSKRPQIGGMAVISEREVVVRLTGRSAPDKVQTVSSSCEMAPGVDAAAIAAERASFKMYYLIASESSATEADAAQKLREGLEKLQNYVSGKDPKALKPAYETFLAVRSQVPAFNEAQLYEGIALDLMERHDDAIQRFHYLADSASTEVLRQKAIYNEAISRFRKYRYEELEKSVELLGRLTGDQPTLDDLAASPVKALALAAKANAIAHRAIFWQRLLFDGTRSREETEILRRKQQKGLVVEGWITTVTQITRTLKDVQMSDDKGWNDLVRRQLKWAIENARGNAHLNFAMNFLAPPHLPGAQEEERRVECLEAARSAFQECELLLPPGVETLTNLATVLWQLSRTEDARNYAQRAIDLNPDYEYAYYRLAQLWEKENKIDKVIGVLKSFAKERTPKNPEFLEIFAKYATELART